ncbi:hypothetical protein GMA19_00532 [Paenibacillus polymyxa E681]|nr:hypothetical protein PPE_00528 [Paenibacillus polymyxa E681]QNV55383.1 hypothetical protein GE561_00533 [Paenibacillus polymyxa E681]QNV60219.1 hypothetical protein GMA19_00532 [Paenibacillus polymyxa E681]
MPCFNCHNIITDTASQVVYIDHMICQVCLNNIDKSVHQKAVSSYPGLVRHIETENGKNYSNSFEEYSRAKMNDALHELYYKKVLHKPYRKKRNEMLKYLPSTLTKIQLSEMKQHAACALTGSSEDVS